MNNPFVEYRTAPLETDDSLHLLCLENNINLETQNIIRGFLGPLKLKGPAYRLTYDHCIRVAELGTEVSKLMHLDPKVLLFAGLMHDIGKVQVPKKTLGKTSGWTDKDSRIMTHHVIDSYRLIAGRFDFTAEIILWHHVFQANPYPKKLPRPIHDYSEGTRVMIPFYGRLLSLCDQFDAFHRINDKHGELKAPTGEEIKALMFKFNPDMKFLVEQLYNKNVFTTFTVPMELTAK
jgi:putative nucleotidyltransferase with HDIG domain